MSLILAIETSNPGAGEASAGIALARAGDPPEVIASARLERGGDEELLPAIARILASANAKPDELSRVGVSIGPGGFTGVRIAVAAAKMICEATGAVCVGVPTALVVARRVTSDGHPFAVALASKRQTAHLTVFDSSGAARDDGAIHGATELERLGVARLIADQHLPTAFRDAVERLAIAIEPPIFDPLACLELTAAGDPVDPIALAPFYPREPEAVMRWRELHGLTS